MRLYYEIALRSFRRATTYRSAYIAGVLTNAFFGALRSFVYIAIYGAGASVAGFSVSDAISYSWATQALISILRRISREPQFQALLVGGFGGGSLGSQPLETFPHVAQRLQVGGMQVGGEAAASCVGDSGGPLGDDTRSG